MIDLNWKSEYEIGITEMDVQHNHLLGIIRSINNHDSSSMPILVQELSRYAEFHFQSEENLMLAYDFTGLVDHHRLHRSILKTLHQQLMKISNKDFSKEELVTFLVKWFTEHTIKEDKTYAEHILDIRVDLPF